MPRRIREGFPKQRLVVVPAQVVARCQGLPVVSQLHVTHIGMYPRAPHHYVERPQGAPEAILIYCLSGNGSLEVDDAQHAIEPGQLVVIPPNVPHVYSAHEEVPWSIFWVHFKGALLTDALKSLGVYADRSPLYVPDRMQMRGGI